MNAAIQAELLQEYLVGLSQKQNATAPAAETKVPSAQCAHDEGSQGGQSDVANGASGHQVPVHAVCRPLASVG